MNEKDKAPSEAQVLDHLVAFGQGKGKKLQCIALGSSSLIDRRVIVDGNHAANVEVKSRHFRPGKYNSMMIDALKWYALAETQRVERVPSWVYVAYLDGSIYCCRPGKVGKLKLCLSTPGGTRPRGTRVWNARSCLFLNPRWNTIPGWMIGPRKTPT